MSAPDGLRQVRLLHPKESSKALLLEAKNNLQRMLAAVPLTDDEPAAVDDGQEAWTSYSANSSTSPPRLAPPLAISPSRRPRRSCPSSTSGRAAATGQRSHDSARNLRGCGRVEHCDTTAQAPRSIAHRADWLAIRVELLHGAPSGHPWPPGREFPAAPDHTFAQFAAVSNQAFARWDLSHFHTFELTDGLLIAEEDGIAQGCDDDPPVVLDTALRVADAVKPGSSSNTSLTSATAGPTAAPYSATTSTHSTCT